MKTELLSAGGALILVILLSFLLLFLMSCQEQQGENEYYQYINTYTVFVANGEEYNTSDVEKVAYTSRVYANSSVTFYMKNGDQVECITDSISWKGKK